MASHPCKAVLSMSERHAQIEAETLIVDEELQKNKVTRSIIADGTQAVLTLVASDERMLRLCLSGCIEMADVVVATLDEFAVSPELTT